MKVLTTEIKQALDLSIARETILLTGEENSGKATAVEALSKSPDVQKLLQLREEINAPEAYIIATDCDTISEDILIVSADFSYKTANDFSNDLALERILCRALHECSGTNSSNNFQEVLEMLIKDQLTAFSPEVFADINNSDFYDFLVILRQFPVKKLITCYAAIANQYEFNAELYAEKLHALFMGTVDLRDLRNDFYSLVAKLVNQYVDKLVKELECEGASFEKSELNYYTLTTIFDVYDYDLPLLKMLLRGYSEENFNTAFCLFENLTLAFRANDELFSKRVDYLSKSNDVFKMRNSNVHSVKFFCTSDLEREVDDDEIFEIPEVLAMHVDERNCNHIIMTVDATEAYQHLAESVTLVNSLPENCKLHILFTHFENFIINKALRFSSESKFNQEFPFDWEENTQQTEKLFRDFTETLKFKVKSNKQQCISWYSLVALHTNLSKSLCDNHSGCVDYPSALAYTLDVIDHFSIKSITSDIPRETRSMNLF